MNDLTICQDCKERPPIYGDGVTWARCAECQYKHEQNVPESEAPIAGTEKEGIEHKMISGLTSIIMPVYNVSYSLFHYTGNAIGSIREHTKVGDYELVIIDNGSPIKVPNLQAYYADKVIVNETNLGVTKAWNQGIRASFGEYIVLINTDIQVFEGWLEGMKAMIDSGEADLVMAHPMYSLTEPFARAVESKAVLEGKRKFDPISRDFACAMFKKSLFDEIGSFDEDYFNYCSDSDFIDRLTAAGKKFAVCDKVAVHHISDATGFSIPETPDIMNKDKETYQRKRQEVPSIQPVEASVEAPQPAPEKPVESKKNENLIRAANTGDRIYYKGKDGKIHWIMSPDVLHALGCEFGQDTILSVSEFAKFEKGENITLDNVEQFK